MKNRIPCEPILFILILVVGAAMSKDDQSRSMYIIHVDKSMAPTPFLSHHDWYASILSSLLSPNETSPAHVYSYNHVINGFSAVLSDSQLDRLEKYPGHIAAYPDTFAESHTTYTPRFLGMNKTVGLWPTGNFGDGMIIGILDSGIWPESESFKDDGMSPIPRRWKGSCESGAQFNSSNCNRKLIGARSFSEGMKQYGLKISTTDDYDSPRDYWGHGTHTSSIAAGRPVEEANYFGYAKGTAKGMASLARLAMYKVLYVNITVQAAAVDILAAMDQAIVDGVDVISASLGYYAVPFDQDAMAIGAFKAMEKGIFVSYSAGNRGPHRYTMLNGAPWVTTVGAGTIDRDFAAEITLGGSNKSTITIVGKSAFPESLLISKVPVYFGHGNKSKEICNLNSLNPKDVTGKIIFCDFNGNDGAVDTSEVRRTGALGAIFSTKAGVFLRPKDFDLPFVAVTVEKGNKIRGHILSTKNPVVDIKFQITIFGTKPNPRLMWFSSRGPSRNSLWTLKPDIIAPGVDILAAWAPNRAAASIGDKKLTSDYAIHSGTSMSAPHVAGVAAVIKAAHRDWSPAAIRSAIMTTAYTLDNTDETIIDMSTGLAGTPLDFGAGHINPEKARNPGLVYDLHAEDYINYLCGLNYTDKQIQTITGRSKSNFSCAAATLDINYPSFILILNDTNTTTYTFKRVLTSVSDGSSEYQVVVKAPTGMSVKIEPMRLSFPRKHSKAEFNMTVEINIGSSIPQGDYIGNHGYIVWKEVKGTRAVRSPVVSAYAP